MLSRALRKSLTPVRTPIGDSWILTSDESTFHAPLASVAPARLLPSGDTYFLLQGDDRELLVTDADHRLELWTPRSGPAPSSSRARSLALGDAPKER